MDDYSYRILEKFSIGIPLSKHETWTYLHNSQVIPHPDNIKHDKAFRSLAELNMIVVSNSRDALDLEQYKLSDQGLTGFKNEKKLRKEPFQKKYWWAIAIVTMIFGFLIDIGKEAVKKKIWPESNQTQPSFQFSKDTSPIKTRDSTTLPQQ